MTRPPRVIEAVAVDGAHTMTVVPVINPGDLPAWCADDAAWYEGHPLAKRRLRDAFEGELAELGAWPAGSLARMSIEGAGQFIGQSPELAHALRIMSVQLAPGVRARAVVVGPPGGGTTRMALVVKGELLCLDLDLARALVVESVGPAGVAELVRQRQRIEGW